LTDIADDAIEVNTAAQLSDSIVRRPLRVVQKGVSDGVYLRWLNDVGGWSYWLFEAKKLVADEYSGGGQVQVFTPNPFVKETFKPLSKDRRTRWEIGTGALQAWEARHLESLADSRNVYLYTGECGNVAECCTYRVEGVDRKCLEITFLSEIILKPFNSIELYLANDSNPAYTLLSLSNNTESDVSYTNLELYQIIINNISGFTNLTPTIVDNLLLICVSENNIFIEITSFFDNEDYVNCDWILVESDYYDILPSCSFPNLDYTLQSINVSFQILINGVWTTIDPEEIVDGVWERTTCDLITAWRIVDEGINTIDSGTFDCTPDTGEDRWLPVEVVGYNLTPRKDSNVKAVRATIQLPDRYTAQV
jgi:hypothetical protein